MTVLSLVKHQNRDTIELLESMLLLANHSGMRDVILAYRDPADGSMHVGVTGVYKLHADKARKDAMRVSMHLASEEDRVQGQS